MYPLYIVTPIVYVLILSHNTYVCAKISESSSSSTIRNNIFGVIQNDVDKKRTNQKSVIVVGSVNADTFLSVLRLPVEGENLTTLCEPSTDMPGGKGCTQAVAVAKLLLLSQHNTMEDTDSSSNKQLTNDVTSRNVIFLGQFGNDSAAKMLQSSLEDVGVQTMYSGQHNDIGSGRGYVFTSHNSGEVSAVVSGGTNLFGWTDYEALWDHYVAMNHNPDVLQSSKVMLDKIFSISNESSSEQLSDVIVMLQREIPEKVNLLVATYSRLVQHKFNSMCIVLDCGGEDRPISSEMLKLCDIIMPNETELRRLVKSFPGASLKYDEILTSTAALSDENVVLLANVLIEHGARNVLVTRGKRGSTFVSNTKLANVDEKLDDNNVSYYHHPACIVDGAIDETGAGDCYRAGFVVACLLLDYDIEDVENDHANTIRKCMEFASVCGALAVLRRGAVPATPSWNEVVTKLNEVRNKEVVGLELRGGSENTNVDEEFPFEIGSRLNSMKDRSELWGLPLKTPHDFVRRQASIKGITCVDFNYPQHFHNFWTVTEAKAALDEVGLIAGAVSLRYEAIQFARGAMNHPDIERRRDAIQLTKEAAQAAIDLGCNEVIVWSAFDGYDYPFQVEYNTKWQELVDAFQECCDAYPNVKFSLEYKPTDENTRFFTVPSTGAAMLMVHEVNRTNFGLTLDVGHMLMSGENPGQSIAMVGRTGKLFGIQLNDGYTRLAAEDGLMFGSVHPRMALEVMYQLLKVGYTGHIYFDTFPQRSDPIKEAEYNIQRVKAYWKAARKLYESHLIDPHMNDHDAIETLKLVDNVLDHII